MVFHVDQCLFVALRLNNQVESLYCEDLSSTNAGDQLDNTSFLILNLDSSGCMQLKPSGPCMPFKSVLYRQCCVFEMIEMDFELFRNEKGEACIHEITLSSKGLKFSLFFM